MGRRFRDPPNPRNLPQSLRAATSVARGAAVGPPRWSRSLTLEYTLTGTLPHTVVSWPDRGAGEGPGGGQECGLYGEGTGAERFSRPRGPLQPSVILRSSSGRSVRPA